MSEVILAKSAGFCFGVKRAVDTVYEEVNKGKKIVTYGPIIHNEEVVKDLESHGVKVVDEVDGLRALKDSDTTVVLRSHGVGKDIVDLLETSNISYVDATCPFVKRIHNTVQKESEAGSKIVIIGNDGHPEVEGIKGWCKSTPVVVENMEQAMAFTANKDDKICIVSQTTFHLNKFQELVEIFKEKGYNVNVVNTICNATEERQTEAREIARKVPTMIVIGGTHSSNSRKLYEICKSECENTYFIQTLDDLHLDKTKAASLVGITAGASTPKNIIEEVQNYVRINF